MKDKNNTLLDGIPSDVRVLLLQRLNTNNPLNRRDKQTQTDKRTFAAICLNAATASRLALPRSNENRRK